MDDNKVGVIPLLQNAVLTHVDQDVNNSIISKSMKCV